MGRQKLDYNKMTNEEILQLFKEQYEKIKPNDAMDFFKRSNYTPTPYILKTRLGLTYGQACIAIGVRKTVRKRYKEDIKHKEYYYNKYKNKIVKIYNELGYIPNTVEIKKYGLSQQTILTVFNMNYHDFIQSIGFNKKDIKNGNCKINETDEELLEMYKNLCFRLGKIATSRDINEDKNSPSATSFIYRFGSINEVKRLSKIDELALDKRLFTKHYIMKNLKEIYIEYGRRLNNEEREKILSNYFERGVSLSTIFVYFKTAKINNVWAQVEKALVHDYIKLLNKNKIIGGIKR
ncbi:hypothetical protein [Clostridium botulinum]|uniref:hypothetical protein n=1 Tax=Clostridium botulinum TaxID=1491 RepID=UPI0007DE5968|nr:hypothetical protein [Clostridium botulinum]KEI92176.1 hypothetical protein N491_09970 [Clostridium botulinum B2 275]NFD55370.1 hypothetical protein [Clostridium botulinum]